MTATILQFDAFLFREKGKIRETWTFVIHMRILIISYVLWDMLLISKNFNASLHILLADDFMD